MDPMHAKAVVDLRFGAPATEDEFYHEHSCDGLHNVRSMVKKIWQLKQRKKHEPLNETNPIEQ